MKKFPDVTKPIIALLHLCALPGDPFYERGTTMEQIVAQAGRDLDALQKGGVDAVLFSNEFSIPYRKQADHLTTAAMGRIIGELRHDIGVPYGVDLLQDPVNIIDLAVAVDASFVREQFTGAFVGESGLFQTNIAETMRRRRALDAMDLKMFYFLNNESDENLVPVHYPDLAEAVIFDCRPDAFCVTGAHAGLEANNTMIEEVREAIKRHNVPVFAATGCRKENVRHKLDISDGILVGTTLKYDGKFENHIDPERVKAFMNEVQAYRKEKRQI